MAGTAFRDGWVLCVVASVLGAWQMAGAQTLSTKAGALYLPGGVAYDSAGNLFVADTLKNEVIELSLAGVQSVVVGTGAQGFAGDGGAANAAMLNAPSSVALGSDGTLYIADTGNQRIRAVSHGGISTVAGTGTAGYGGDGGDALLAQLRSPTALAVDSAGALLIADTGNHCVRRLAGGKLITIAGSGTQGFGGDGAAATQALLDTPMGVAAASDGRVFVGDSHNHRIRVIGTDGVIRTFAGSGVRGFSGEGGAATSASVFLPRGVAVTVTGDVWFADADNHRLRTVSASDIITTLAGDGVQGSSVDGVAAKAASIDSPRGVAVSSFGAPALSDGRNRVVQTIATDQDVYALVPGNARAASVTLSSAGTTTYGQGSVAVVVQSAAPTPLGLVTLLEGGSAIAAGTLANSATTLGIDTLNAGQHTLQAEFPGDGLHAPAVSTPVVLAVAPRTVTAAALPATVVYGSAVPLLTGTLTGVLPRDAANVVATFISSAGDLAQVGTYPVAASLSGSASGNYALATGGSLGGVQVVPAGVSIVVNAPSLSYAGMPITLSAALVPAARGTPTGNVTFADNGVTVATATAAGGAAVAVLLNLASGAHSFTAVYGGDHNFLAATSSPASVTVGAIPDFVISVIGSGSQTVQGGSIATYALQVASQALPFSGAVSFSVSGMPSGATANFSPTNVIPGSNSAAVTMSVQTKVLAFAAPVQPWTSASKTALACLMPLIVFAGRRRRLGVSIGTIAMVALIGCGARTVSTTHAEQTFPLTVTGTSTNLAGAVVSHSVGVNLTVE